MNGLQNTINKMISEPQDIKDQETVGDEFMNWAEQYWLLDKLVNVENPDTFAGEKCDYKYMRGIFVEKINAIIKNRLG